MRKLSVFALVLALTALLLLSAACAAGPAGGLRGKKIPSAPRGRTILSISGPERVLTGNEAVWTVTDTGAAAGRIYCYTPCKDDHSFADENIMDIQYIYVSGSRTFSWTCYDPGEYGLFVEAYDSMEDYENGNYAAYDLCFFTVSYNPAGDLLRTRVEEIAELCRRDTEYQTARAIYDWVIEQVEYDESYTYYTADAAILDGRGVCNSYAKAYTLIACQAGLRASRVTGLIRDENGEPDENGGHAWNVVSVDGKWYKLDATWDDGLGYAYFLVDDELIEVEHCKTQIDFGDVTCCSMDANYFITEDRWTHLCDPIPAELTSALAAGYRGMTWDLSEVIEDGLSWPYYLHLIGKVAKIGMEKGGFVWRDGSVIAAPDYSPVVSYSMDGSDAYVLSYRLETSREFFLPLNVSEVSEESFAGAAAHEVYLPDGVTMIGDGAFSGMPLWEIRIPATVTFISPTAFSGITAAETTVITDSEYVRQYALDLGFTVAGE